ncbi:hypothetical protein JCM6882_005630 [Rhodosporidiobolus microsporus]
MTTVDPAVALSARLLRLSTSLAALVDPAEGAKAVLVQPLVDEMKRVLDQESALVTPEVNTLLSSAIDSLSSPSDTSPSLSYTSLVTAVARITAAAERLATSSVLPPPLARLPTELVARIVQFVQDEPDILLRQRTNLTLSRSTRLLHTLVQPILNVEVAVGTPRQLEWLADKVENIGADALGFKCVSIDLHLDELKRTQDGSWPGRLVFPTLGGLATRGHLESLSVRLRSASPWSLNGRGAYATSYGDEIEEVLGLADDDWWDFCHRGPNSGLPPIADLDLPNLSSTSNRSDFRGSLYQRSNKVRHLRIGCTSPPSITSASSLRLERLEYERDLQIGRTTAGFHYDVLAVPFHTFYPSDFLPLIAPVTPSTTPTITHLEVTFRIANEQQDLPVIAQILTTLSPSLRRLALRIKYDGIADYKAAVLPALQSCQALEHLEMGGNFVDDDALETLGYLFKLRRLVLLSWSTEDFDVYTFADSLSSDGSRMCITLCLPGPQIPFAGWPPHHLRYFIETCSCQGYSLRIEERPEEWAWMASDRDM